MQLEKTVDMMLSDDYKERFKAEYYQVMNRRNKLDKAAKEIKDVKSKQGLYIVYRWQLRAMDDYIYVLKLRAEVEGISLSSKHS